MLLLGGLGCGSDGVAEVPLSEVLATQEEAVNIARQFLNGEGNTLEQKRLVAAEIATLPNVAAAGVSDDDVNIWIRYDDGRDGLLLLNPKGTRGGGSSVATTTPPFAFPAQEQTPIGGTKVLIWAPYHSEFRRDSGSETEELTQMLLDSQCPLFDVEVILDEAATRETVQRFTEFDTVHMITHGALIESGDIVFLTGETVLPSAPGRGLDDEGMPFDNPVVTVPPDGPPWPPFPLEPTELPDHVYAIRPADVRALPGEFHNTLIFNASCNSLGNDTLSQSFLDKGAKGYFGWSRTVDTSFAADTSIRVYEGMLGRVESAKAAFDKVDPIRMFIVDDDRMGFTELMYIGEDSLIYPCLIGAEVIVDGGGPIWTTATQVTMSMLDVPELVYDGSSSCAFGETGIPYFSEEVPADALFYPVRRMDDPVVRTEHEDTFLPRQSCTNFIATKNVGRPDEQLRIVAGEWPIDPSGEDMREYQVRYSRDKNGEEVTESCVVGEVPDPYGDDEGVKFREQFNALCDVRLVYGPVGEPPAGVGGGGGGPAGGGSPLYEAGGQGTAVAESDTGMTVAVFTITLDVPADDPIEIGYETQDVTARAGRDYVGVSGTIVFEEGEDTKTVEVEILGDTENEPHEEFVLELTSVTPRVAFGRPPVAIILNDDAGLGPPLLSILPDAATEGDEGQNTLRFRILLSHETFEPISVTWTTSDGSAMTADGDYIAASGTVTFEPGEVAKSVEVVVNGDLIIEGDETIFVTLSDVMGDAIEDRPVATGTIVDDDRTPEVSVVDVSEVEGNSGTLDMVFTVMLSDAYFEEIGVDIEARNRFGAGSAAATGGASAAPGVDYVIDSARLIFPPGSREQTFSVAIVGDTESEPDEEFEVVLRNATNPANIVVPIAVGTILDDDGDEWSTPVLLEDSELSGVGSIRTAINASGQALVAWRQSGQVRAAGFTGSWSDAEDIGSVSPTSGPSIALTDSGAVTVGWSFGEAAVSTASFPNLNWTTPEDISTRSPTFSVSMATNASGTVLASWRETSGEAPGNYVSFYTPGSGWQETPTRIDTAELVPLGGAPVALDDAGNAFVIWVENDDINRRDLHARRYDASLGEWSEPDILDVSAFDVSGAALDVDPSTGDAAVAWSQGDAAGAGADRSIWATRFDLSAQTDIADPDWQNAEIMENAIQTAIGPGVAISGDRVFVTWREWDDFLQIYDVWANPVSGNVSTWDSATAVPLETIDQNCEAPRVAADANGGAIVVWAQQADATRTRIRASRYANGFGQPVNIQGELPADPELGDALGPTISVSSNGRAVVAWSETTSIFVFGQTRQPIRSTMAATFGD